MSEFSQPSPDELERLKGLAIAEVHIAQCLLKARAMDANLKERFPKAYAAILHATARKRESDTETRHRIYELLNCTPKARP